MNGLLLDTHVFLWYSSDDRALPEDVKEQIMNEAGGVYVSSVSAWEIAIKHGLEKLELPQPREDLFDLSNSGLEFAEPSVTECVAYSRLGFPLKDHRDPFDRMLVVQAKERNLRLVTADRVFDSYLPSELVVSVRKRQS